MSKSENPAAPVIVTLTAEEERICQTWKERSTVFGAATILAAEDERILQALTDILLRDTRE
jgi:hypothetical protein